MVEEDDYWFPLRFLCAAWITVEMAWRAAVAEYRRFIFRLTSDSPAAASNSGPRTADPSWQASNA
jgi:hypothetical protein